MLSKYRRAPVGTPAPLTIQNPLWRLNDKLVTELDWTTIASLQVPRGKVLTFRAGDMLRCYIPTRERIAHSGAGAEALAVTYVPAQSPNLPITSEARAWTVALPPVPLVVNAIDTDNGTVTVTHNAAENVDVDYLIGTGGVRLLVSAPVGGRMEADIWSNDLLVVHEGNQTGEFSAQRIDTAFSLWEKWVLSIQVRTPAPIVWSTVANNRNLAQVNLPAVWENASDFYAGMEQAAIQQLYSML